MGAEYNRDWSALIDGNHVSRGMSDDVPNSQTGLTVLGLDSGGAYYTKN